MYFVYIFPFPVSTIDVVLQATTLIKDICTNLHTAAKSVQDADYTVVLRGDSTLRGHFPEASDVTIVKYLH